MKFWYITFILIFSIASNSTSKAQPDGYKSGFFSDKELKVGEELTYVVKYSVMKLGEVRLKIKDKKTIDGRTFYVTYAYIDSYSGIPFVDLHQIYESYVDENLYSDFF